MKSSYFHIYHWIQKGVKKFTALVLSLLLIILMPFVFISPPKAYAFSNPAAVPLLTVSNFAALAKSEITNAVAGTVLNNGDMGLDSPATCTGFPSPCTGVTTNGTINNGMIQYQNAVALQGQTDATAVVTNLNGRTANQSITDGLLDGLTLTQGVYDVPATTTNLTGDLTLNGDANSIFIFRASSDFITASTSRVLFTGGAQACNVYWTVVSQATFDGATQFAGTVFAGSSVVFSAGGATLNGRVVAQTAAITFNNTTVNKSSCAGAGAGAGASSGGSSSSSTTVCPAFNYIVPIIIESRRIDVDSVFISWGPYSGINTFNVQYGFENGKWLYNTNVTGFSTTINDLPPNQPIWIQVAATNNCSIGVYGAPMLVGGPSLPNAGFITHENNIPWYIPAGIFVLSYFLLKLRRI